MRILAFLGLGAVTILFCTILLLSINSHYITECSCQIVMLYQDFYIFFALGISIFFLLFCTLLLTKKTELIALLEKKSSDKQTTPSFDPTHYTIYQLPLVQLFSKISFIGSLGIFFLAIATFYPSYNLVGNCSNPSECQVYFMDTELYLIWYGLSGLYFTFLSIMVHRNISRYKTQPSNS